MNCELVLHDVCGHMAPLIVPAKGMGPTQVGGPFPACSLLPDGPLMRVAVREAVRVRVEVGLQAHSERGGESKTSLELHV